MTQFSYTAISIGPGAQGSGPGAGAMVSGRQEALDERRLRDDLRRRGLVAIEVRPVRMADALRAVLSRDRLRRSDAAWFFQNLRLLLSSAVPIESAMATLIDLAPNPRLRAVCAGVREKLRSGASLADAAAAAPGLAGPQHLALLRAGHESGRLAHAVQLIDTGMAGAERIRRLVIGRLTYPLILLIVAVLAVWFLASFVIPKFAQTLESAGAALPLSTALTLAGARLMVWVIPPLLVLGVLAFAFRAAVVPASMKDRVSRFMLRAPVVGTLIWNMQAALLTDILATMIEGGGNVLSGLEQAQSVVSSPALGERLSSARRQVREGADLGQAFASNRVLPPMAGAVLQVGIKGGDLVGGLRRASQVCQERQERLSERLMLLLEPAVILFMAMAVGWVVYSLVMGMLAMNDMTGL